MFRDSEAKMASGRTPALRSSRNVCFIEISAASLPNDNHMAGLLAAVKRRG